MKKQNSMKKPGCPALEMNVSPRAEALATRLEAGAAALASFAESLSQSEWETRVVKDGRKIGVMVHHVAVVYPIEIQLAKALAAGHPISGLSWKDIAAMNSDHAQDNDAVTKQVALELLAVNSAAAATAIRCLTDEELDRAAPVSLNGDAPLTCQFMLEDHAVRHSYHHLAGMKATLAGESERGLKGR